MSFKFEYKNKPYWAKQTEVYLLEKKGLSEKVTVLDGKPTKDEIVQAIDEMNDRIVHLSIRLEHRPLGP